jgi:hypothetical protein
LPLLAGDERIVPEISVTSSACNKRRAEVLSGILNTPE